MKKIIDLHAFKPLGAYARYSSSFSQSSKCFNRNFCWVY
jgi:hypothetical protein